MTSRDFWRYVDEQKDKLVAQHMERVKAYTQGGKKEDFSAFNGQPADGKSLFIVSRHSLDKGTEAGSICTATTRLAAQRIVEGTHEIATADQIAAYELEREAQAEEIQKMEILRKQQFILQMPSEMMASTGGKGRK